MLLEIERDKAITDKVILIQKVVRGFKDRCALKPLLYFLHSFYFMEKSNSDSKSLFQKSLLSC